MTFVFGDNVREAVNITSPTATVPLGGAVANSRGFSSVAANSNTAWTVIRVGAQLSAGEFTFNTGSPNTLTQTTVRYSTSANAPVTFSSGLGEAFMDMPAYYALPLYFFGLASNVWSVGINQGTNPVFAVDFNTVSTATGIKVTGAAAAGGAALAAISSGTNEGLKIDAKGSGSITFNGTATGQLLAGLNGTVALPAWSFSSDPDTGIYRIGANNIGVAVNGAKVLDVSATGLGVVGTTLGGDGAVALPGFSFTSDPDSGLYRIGANNIGVAVNGAKVLDVATTGMTVVGAVDATAASGYKLGGLIALAVPGNYMAVYDSLGITPRIQVGKVGTDSSTYYDHDAHVFRTSSQVTRATLNGTGLLPTDNTYKLGDSSNRWTTVYAVTGTINTSDAEDKVIGKAPEAAVFEAILSVPMTFFQWKDSVEAKGEKGARLHYGPTAQAVRDALTKRGIDPTRLALFCIDPIMAFEDYDETTEYEDTEPYEDSETYFEGEEEKTRTVVKLRKITKKHVMKKQRAVDTGKTRLGLRLDQFDRLRTEAVRRLVQKI